MLFTPFTQLRGRQNWFGLQTRFSLQKITILTSLFLWLFLTEVATAQCTMVCNGANIDSPNNASLNEDCVVILTADAILEAPESCPGPKTLQVSTNNGVLIATGLETVTISGIYVDQILRISVIDNNTENSCWGYLMIEDKFAPQLDCTDISTVCSAPIHPDNIGYPTIAENCDNNVDLFFMDAITNFDCDPNLSASITRTWTATDNSGNTGTCSQVINLIRPDINDVIFPNNIDLDCSNPDADPSITGLPTINGRVINNNDFCELAMDFQDDTTFICGTASFQILREFTITDHCMSSNNVRMQSQIIHFLDEEAPVINCPPTLAVGTDLNDCSATINLDVPATTDNCSDFDLRVVTSYGAQGFGPHFNVPAGIHTITYRATDDCNNIATCETTLTVSDNQVPFVVCDDLLIISLNSSGVAALQATSIDDNSHDNCTTQLDYLVARMDDLSNGFGSLVTFDCSDLGQNVMVILRVRETNNPDLFSECMVEIEVQDKIAPFLDCPDNLTIDCEADYSNLDIFGEVEVFEPCGVDLTTNSSIDINNCGVGTIFRNFTATDPSGNQGFCTQIIQVQNNTPFTEDDILWPADYTTSDCNPSLEPGDLPSNSREPIVLNETCGLIAASHEDEVFTIAGQACIKILRHWTVIDWCVFDPVFPNGGGIFEYLQVIKVVDQIAPTIQCPSNVVAAVTNDCSSGFASLDLATATDCSTSLSISNNAPLGNQNSADASGTYPLGTTTVTFTATDGCGNFNSCTTTVTIEDQKAPTPLCLFGLSGNLMPMNGGGMVMVSAEIFNNGSTDNCTAPEDLTFTIQRLTFPPASPQPSTTELMFTCDDEGTQPVEVWITDEEGNSAFCETFIIIQANNGVCGSNRPYISGSTRTAENYEVQDVTVRIEAESEAFVDSTYTAIDGNFMIHDIPLEESYTITPKKDTNPLNGVSTLDLILISKHILGMTPLDSPYKMIAADVNQSGNISTADIIALRKLILGLSENFTNNTSWRFVDADFEFSDPSRPFDDDFPEYIDLEHIQNSSIANQFVAIKVGDVNGSVIPNAFAEAVGDRSQTEILGLNTKDEYLKAGESHQLEVTVADISELLGCQFTLNFDEHAIDILDITAIANTESSNSNFAWSLVQDGSITASWAVPYPIENVDENTVLFQIEVAAKQAVQLSDALHLSSDVTVTEAYTSELERLDMNLEFTNPTVLSHQSIFELYQNRPNPFQDKTTISFQLPSASSTNLTIYDVSGKVVYQAQYDLEAGYQEISLSENELPVHGILYYQVKTPTATQTMKMFKL